MSRSGYSDECENMGLWRGTVLAAIRGKRGQALLRDMAAALDAMPEKVLISGDLVTEDGACCALGAVGLHRGIPRETLIDIDPEDSHEVAGELGIADALAREVTYENDEAFFGTESPAERWTRMRAWVARNLSPLAADQEKERT